MNSCTVYTLTHANTHKLAFLCLCLTFFHAYIGPKYFWLSKRLLFSFRPVGYIISSYRVNVHNITIGSKYFDACLLHSHIFTFYCTKRWPRKYKRTYQKEGKIERKMQFIKRRLKESRLLIWIIEPNYYRIYYTRFKMWHFVYHTRFIFVRGNTTTTTTEKPITKDKMQYSYTFIRRKGTVNEKTRIFNTTEKKKIWRFQIKIEYNSAKIIQVISM